MTAYVYETPNEKAISGALALVMHALFFAMLVVSVTWQKRESAALVAELWSNLPSPKAVAPPPAPKVEPAPEPKVEKPVPKAEPRPQPKAEIDLREKRARELKAREQALAEKKKREEQQRLEAQKKQAADAEARRLAQEQSDALKKLAQQQAQASAQAREKEIDKYTQAIKDRIRRFIVRPPNLQGNPEVELDIILLPNGEVLDVKTRVGSGQPAWDNAVERAIRRAQPLPVPADTELFNKNFREFRSKSRPD